MRDHNNPNNPNNTMRSGRGALRLPPQITVSEEETALIVEFVKLLRDPVVWLKGFFEWALARHAQGYDLTVSDAIGMLNAIGGLLKTGLWLQSDDSAPILRMFARQLFPELDHPLLQLHPDYAGDDEEEQFLELVRVWRTSYPEPKARITSDQEAE